MDTPRESPDSEAVARDRSSPAANAAALRVLVVYYSQSGDVTRAVESLVRPIEETGAALVRVCLEPVEPFPSPWKRVGRFFDVFPECITANPPPIHPPEFDADGKFDLVILAYQVWFLSPSLPVQAFFTTPHAAALADTKVVTLSVSRNMWQSASETMKKLIAQAGGIHIDNAVITHQGPAWATFITTTRSLLFGKRDRLWGIFPPAGILDEDFEALSDLGGVIAGRLDEVRTPSTRPLLRGTSAVRIDRKYVIPEFIGWYAFYGWGSLIRTLGRISRVLRRIAVYGFVLFLVTAIVIGIPLVLILRLLLYPVLRAPLAKYIQRLQLPSVESARTSANAPQGTG